MRIKSIIIDSNYHDHMTDMHYALYYGSDLKYMYLHRYFGGWLAFRREISRAAHVAIRGAYLQLIKEE